MNKTQIKNQRQATGGSDSGQGSEADDGIRMAYHFYIPNHLCGTCVLTILANLKQLIRYYKNV